MVKDKKAPKGSYPGPTGTPLYLKGLDKCPQQDAYGVTLAKQLDQPCCPEEAKEAQIDEVVLQRRSIVFKSFISLSKSADSLLPFYNLSSSPCDP